jgi:isoaspartyl peptidase/L-asparaginase-like protein (Ntn-hydrolase superfamily)
MTRRSRREFLHDAARASAAWAATVALARGARAGKPPPAAELPVVVATWDFGLALCTTAQKQFAAGADLLDALERGVNVVEDDPNVTSVGYGGLPNEDGVVQLDAAIMDGRTHRAGAVCALEGIKNPISVARKVMTETEHVMLAGAGALKFARKMGFKEQNLLLPESRAKWEKAKASFWRHKAQTHDTVCAIALDAKRDMATCVSTSGLAWKLAGRVGDSPILGAGSYVDNDVGGAAATGMGELSMRTCASFAVVERMRAGAHPTQACQDVLAMVARKDARVGADEAAYLALIALDKRGRAGAAVIGKGAKPFPYALARGLTEAPAMHEVQPVKGRS